MGQEEFEAGRGQSLSQEPRQASAVPGFRKGKAPWKVIEGMYGAGVFYEDAIEEIYPQAMPQAIEQRRAWIPWPLPGWKSPIWGRRASPSRPLSLSVP
ncbi:MAG: trigger factor family protein [Flavonifractor plautii]